MKKITKILKQIFLSLTLMYSFNMLFSSLNLNVAVNPYSLGVVTVLGIPGMISLIIIKFIIK